MSGQNVALTEHDSVTNDDMSCRIFCVSVKDLLPQQDSLTSFLQGTPMKPSQVFFHPSPRRMLPLPSPEPCPKDRLDPPPPPRLLQGPMHSSGHVPVSPVNVGSSANKRHPTPRNRLDPVSHSAQPQRSSRSQLSPTNSDTSTNVSCSPLISTVYSVLNKILLILDFGLFLSLNSTSD